MAAATITNMSAILKKIWPQDDVSELMYANSPLLAMVPKQTDWSGTSQEIVLGVGLGGGWSATFDKAKLNKSQSKKVKMSVETCDNFQLWSVDHKLLTLSRNDKGAVVRAIESETKAKMQKFKRMLCWQLYGNGGGAIGRVATTTTLSSTTLTFRTNQTVRRLDIDDYLVFATDNGDPTASQAGVLSGRVKVTAIDEDNNAVTVDVAPATAIVGCATSNYVFIEGAYGNVLYGAAAYVPSSAPSTSIWGMARTTNVQRLSGIRVGGLGLLIQEAVKKALMKAQRANAEITHIFMSPADFLELELSLGTAKRYADEKVGRVGFTGLEFTNPGGGASIKVFSDADCDDNSIWGFAMPSWKLHTAGEFPDFLNINGNKYEMEEASNSFEGRIGGYGQMYTDAPGHQFFLDRTV